MTPQEALDRIATLCDEAESGHYPTLPARPFVRSVRKVLADVTPEPGVIILTSEEAALALRWKRDAVRHGYVIDIPDDDLTARLEAAQ